MVSLEIQKSLAIAGIVIGVCMLVLAGRSESNVKVLSSIGIAFLAVGIIGLLYGYPWLSGNKKVVDDKKKATYDIQGASSSADYASVAASDDSMASAVGLASSLLPREIASQEDFGDFSPEALLKNQSFLDPTQSIGINTMSGSLRNANQQVRAEFPNPQGKVVFNQTTITPNKMQVPSGICGN